MLKTKFLFVLLILIVATLICVLFYRAFQNDLNVPLVMPVTSTL